MSEAVAIRHALAMSPGMSPGAADGWRRLAYAIFATDPAAAARNFARALAVQAAAGDWNNLAEARRVAGLPGAARAARRALASDPTLAEAHNTQGNLQQQAALGIETEDEKPGTEEEERKRKDAPTLLEAAIVAFARALALRADFPHAAYNHAAAIAETGDVARAADLYEILLQRYPEFLEARWNLALALLAVGRWREGWQAHECRRADPRLAPRAFAVPAWDGSPPGGRRLLLAAEQGFGDTIQFLRYVPEAIALGARVTLDVPAPLRALAASILGLDRLIVTGDPVPEVELEAPLMSLPLLLGPERPPPSLPYLAADPLRRAIWRARLADGRSGIGPMTIGIAWAGNPDQRNDRRRSIPDAALAPLAALHGVRFVSLQKGRALPPACRESGWLDAAPDLGDFAETAALIAELDLVIAVDTAVAHLAGALGKPVWVLLSSAADWRWPRGQSRTPWYLSARQVWRRPGESWHAMLVRLADQLATPFFDPQADPA